MARRVRNVLRSRRAPASIIDDAIQTAAERALRRAEGFDSLDGCVNWAVKVAWHEVQAQWRREARVSPGDAPERTGGSDPAREVEERLAIAAAIKNLALLSETERRAILSSLDDCGLSGKPLSAAEKMRRSRARRRLTALVAGSDTQLAGPISRQGVATDPRRVLPASSGISDERQREESAR
ncbi:MAG TPA: sigma factor [Acidimicrobiales bacterium]|nr:sigma factor [Acidimicrobiales bacterium]